MEKRNPKPFKVGLSLLVAEVVARFVALVVVVIAGRVGAFVVLPDCGTIGNGWNHPSLVPPCNSGGGVVSKVVVTSMNDPLGRTRLLAKSPVNRRGASVGGGSSSKKKKKKRSRGPASRNVSIGRSNKGNTGTDTRTRRNENGTSKKTGGSSSDSSSCNTRATTKEVRATSSSPPWQVMSTKEASENVLRERERRSRIRQGLEPTHTTTTATAASDDDPNGPLLSKAFLTDAERRFVKWKPFNPQTSVVGMEFVGSYLEGQPVPDAVAVPQVAFLGRSNVGKSSLINQLSSSATGASRNADRPRVGKTPGVTAAVNLYELYTTTTKNDVKSRRRPVLGWIDLPGFGYAKLSKTRQKSIQVAAEKYLELQKRSGRLALAVLLLDARRDEPAMDDKAVLAALYDMGVPLLVLATKADQLKKAGGQQLETNLRRIREALGLPENQPLAVSGITGEGCRTVWRIILEACDICVGDFRSRYERLEDEHEDGDYTAEEARMAGEELSERDYLSAGSGHDDDDREYLVEEDLVYSQGYDWIQASANVYEYDEDYELGEGYVNEGRTQVDSEQDMEQQQPKRQEERGETFRSLKRRARDLERRGEL